MLRTMKQWISFLAIPIGLGVFAYSLVGLLNLDHFVLAKYSASARDTQALMLGTLVGISITAWGIFSFERSPKEPMD